MYFKKSDYIINNLNLELINKLLGEYSNVGEIKSYQVLPEGFENISILLHTQKSKYILRVSEIEKDHRYYSEASDLIETELNFIKFLKHNNIHVPYVFETNNQKSFTCFDIKHSTIFLVLFSYIEGEHLPYSKDTNRLVAGLQSNLHKVSKKFPFVSNKADKPLYSSTAYRLENLAGEKRESIFPELLYSKLLKQHQAIIQKLENYFLTTEKTFIHCDVKRDNLLFYSNSEIRVIDFGDCRLSVVAEDLGVYIWDLCDQVYKSQLNFKSLVRQYLENYQELNHDFGVHDKVAAIYYAIDRYLNINLYYLVKNQYSQEKMKYQIDKANYQLEIINVLFDLANEISSIHRGLVQ